MDRQGFCFRKIDRRPMWFCRVRSPSLGCGLQVGSCVSLVLAFIPGPCLWPQARHLSSLYLYSSIWKSGIILAAYLTSKGYARISRLKFAKCLEINGGKIYMCIKYYYHSPLSTFSLSPCAILGDLVSITLGLIFGCYCIKWPSPIIQWFAWNWSFLYHQGEFPNQSILDWLSIGHVWQGFLWVYL